MVQEGNRRRLLDYIRRRLRSPRCIPLSRRLDFQIGDGALNYGPETVRESYYKRTGLQMVLVGSDFQRIVNPAYNHNRGPLWVESLRLHMELSKDMLLKRH